LRHRALELFTEPHLAAGGEAIARAPDGRVVFISGAAPKERVRVRVVEERPRFLRANVEEILEPSALRTEPACPHFGACGGCQTQHVAAEAQTESKQKQLEDALARIAKVDLSLVRFDPAWRGAPYGHRARARLAIAPRSTLGYRRRSSREIVAVERCPILTPELEAFIVRIKSAIRDVRSEEEIDLVADGDRVLASVSRALLSRNPDLRSIEGVIPEDDPRSIAIEDPVRGPLRLAPQVFSQSSPEGNAAMVDHVRELSRAPAFEGEVLELYSGSGNFTRVIAPRARSVLAIEGSKEAVALARSVLPKSVELRAEPVERAVAKLERGGRRFDAALADPPRAGMSADLPKQIAALGVRSLIYVSCDPATFARDVGRLANFGLFLCRVRLFDLYPQTGHAEVIGLLAAQNQ
jgi:23S rRNA (uracil1939-C5)-methyltransferase